MLVEEGLAGERNWRNWWGKLEISYEGDQKMVVIMGDGYLEYFMRKFTM